LRNCFNVHAIFVQRLRNVAQRMRGSGFANL
jgi:hypothetical protein